MSKAPRIRVKTLTLPVNTLLIEKSKHFKTKTKELRTPKSTKPCTERNNKSNHKSTIVNLNFNQIGSTLVSNNKKSLYPTYSKTFNRNNHKKNKVKINKLNPTLIKSTTKELFKVQNKFIQKQFEKILPKNQLKHSKKSLNSLLKRGLLEKTPFTPSSKKKTLINSYFLRKTTFKNLKTYRKKHLSNNPEYNNQNTLCSLMNDENFRIEEESQTTFSKNQGSRKVFSPSIKVNGFANPFLKNSHKSLRALRSLKPCSFGKSETKRQGFKKKSTNLSARLRKYENIIKQRLDTFIRNKLEFKKVSNTIKTPRTDKILSSSSDQSVQVVQVKKHDRVIDLGDNHLACPLKFFSRKATNMDFNLRNIRIKSFENVTAKTEVSQPKVNYNKFKIKNPKKRFLKHRSISRSRLHQKTPRNLHNKKSVLKSICNTVSKNKLSTMQFESKSDSIDLSKRMQLPKGFGNVRHKFSLLVKPGSSRQFEEFQKKCFFQRLSKLSKFEIIQFQKQKKLLKSRENYKNLFNQHIRNIKDNARQIFEKYSINLID